MESVGSFDGSVGAGLLEVEAERSEGGSEAEGGAEGEG